jgi:cellulose synthase/poly-beta-1,6-N-acetylglucosamine synthase-like glycosyltransferase
MDLTMEHLIYYKIIQIQVHHLQERNGKIGAMNRGMEFVKTPIVILVMLILT